MWMNRYDIDEAVFSFGTHPVLGPAARFLREFQQQVDAHSDGWPYWTPPSKAAAKLMVLLYGHLRAGMGAYPTLPDPTPADVRRCLTPIKSFMSKRGNAAGMTLPRIHLKDDAHAVD